MRAFPNYSVSAELLGIALAKDEAGDVQNHNSGGETLYLAPGARARFSEHVALSVSPAIPIHQDLNGDQVETKAKLTLNLSFSF